MLKLCFRPLEGSYIEEFTCTSKDCYVRFIVIIPHTFANQDFGDLISPRGLDFERLFYPLVCLLLDEIY
jgi:hypothetical protein